ncbi:hypothetical protein HID58_092029 [Brassica napus]|uniref:RING-type domain-containing protein n=1 Tax=Brassica napus TaxID=3708 RepID=A0ABQ7X028_BRANA|nr:hypothetical protein HID58_092029 [Brassica napus]
MITVKGSDLEDWANIDYYPSLPFAALFSAFKARGLKVTCLLCYCSEGDNIPDAFLLAEAASKLTGLTPDKFHGEEGGKWRIPYSWKSMYGAPPDCPCFNCSWSSQSQDRGCSSTSVTFEMPRFSFRDLLSPHLPPIPLASLPPLPTVATSSAPSPPPILCFKLVLRSPILFPFPFRLFSLLLLLTLRTRRVRHQNAASVSLLRRRLHREEPFSCHRGGKTPATAVDCAVCLLEFEEGDYVRTLPLCFHASTLSASNEWLRSHPNCPLCRTAILRSGVVATTSPFVPLMVLESVQASMKRVTRSSSAPKTPPRSNNNLNATATGGISIRESDDGASDGVSVEIPEIHVDQAASISVRKPEIESVLVTLPQKYEIAVFAAAIGSVLPDIGADSGDGKLIVAADDESMTSPRFFRTAPHSSSRLRCGDPEACCRRRGGGGGTRVG